MGAVSRKQKEVTLSRIEGKIHNVKSCREVQDGGLNGHQFHSRNGIGDLGYGSFSKS